MDKTKIFISNETDALINLNTESETGSPNILNQEHDTSNVNVSSYAKMTPKFKRIYKGRKENTDKHLEGDNDGSQQGESLAVISEVEMGLKRVAFTENKMTFSEFVPKAENICRRRKEIHDNDLEEKSKSLNKEIAHVSAEVNSHEYEETVAHQSTEKVHFSSAKKFNSRNEVFKYLRKAIGNPFEIIKNIKLTKKKGKMVITSKSTEIFPEEGKYISRIEESNKKNMYPTKLNILQDTKSGITTVKKCMEPDMLATLEMQSETSIHSKDVFMPLSSTRSIFEPITQIDSELRSQSSTIKSAKEVLKDFRCFMQFKTESLESFNSDLNREDLKPFRKSGISNSDHYTRAATESVCKKLVGFKDSASKSSSQNIKDFTKEDIESATTQDSRIKTKKVSLEQVDNSTTVLKTMKNIPRQRIVYDERVEFSRGWIIQQIKDKEICLKFKIMEGKYSKDVETKTRCIKEAEDIQEETDELFDALDDTEKAINTPERFKGYSDSIQHKLFKSEHRRKKILKLSEVEPKRLSSLFNHLRKSSSSEFNNEKVFQRIHSENLRAVYNEFLSHKIISDLDSNNEQCVKNVVDKFYLTLTQHRSKVKWRIPHSEKKSLEDYKNYLCNLKTAANENLNCLKTLIPQVASVILPLMSYLSQSEKKMIQIFTFLDKERPDVFLEFSHKNMAFFEDFCQRHF